VVGVVESRIDEEEEGKRRGVSILGKVGEEGDADADAEGDDDQKSCMVGVLEVDEKTVQEDKLRSRSSGQSDGHLERWSRCSLHYN
jgi:hypothetical protein